MKKLINIPNGGFRLFSDDFRFLQEADTEALEMAIKPLSKQHEVIILFGCEISSSGGNTTVTDGAVIKNGEIMRFDEQIFPDPVNPEFAYWITDDVVLQSRNFQNGDNNPIYRENVAKIEVTESLPADSLKIGETPRFFEVITQSLTKPEWIDLPGSTHDFPTTGPAARYLKDNSGMVHLSGFFTEDDPTAGQSIGQLPLGFRPAEDLDVLYVSRTNDSTGFFYRFKIKTDGDIIAVDQLAQTINLSQFPSFKAVEV